MNTPTRATCSTLAGLLVAVTVAGCSSGSGMGDEMFRRSTQPPATASQPSYTWRTEQLSSSAGDRVSALAEVGPVGSLALAAAVADQVLIDGAPEPVGAQVRALASGPDGLSASTAAGIYQRSASGWELVLDGPNGPAALAETPDRLYAFSDLRLDLYAQATWTHQNGVLPNGWQPTAAASHGGQVWVGGQTSDGPAFLAYGTDAAGFTRVTSPAFLCGPDEVQRVTDLLSANGELFLAVGIFARASDAPIRGELFKLDASGQPQQVLLFQQDVPAALASLDGVLYVGTLSGRLLDNALGTLWQPDTGLPPNQGIHSLLAYQGTLVVGAAGPQGALLLTRSLASSAPSSSGGAPGAAGLPAEVAAALADCAACHAWVNDPAQVTARVDVADPPNSLLLLKATNAAPHGGGATWTTTGNAHYDAVLAWIQNGAPAGAGGPATGGGAATAPGPGFVHTWPLIGQHAQADCTDCHGGGVFAGTPTDCASCHINDYNLTTAPAHLTSGYPTDCQRCHTPNGFAGASFTHPWPFEGAHVRVANDCTACHQGGVFAGTSKDCSSCHLQDYVATVQPQHMAAGFPTTCDGCHTTDTFAAANFTHKWPFTGAHLNVARTCNACHGDGVYAGRSTACYSCHSQNFLTAVEPNHTAAALPTSCETCHTTATFAQAPGFTHTWPLTGRHATIATQCNSCHSDMVFAGKSNACVSCHAQDYAQAVPNHTASGFSTDCQSCHTTTMFAGATFNHRFPQNHRNANSCSDCHPNSNNFADFSCFSCHGQTRTNNQHNGRRGYSYNSAACVSCHPNGRS
ncbi:MAG: hypothetical protein KDD82_16530 [Planctomycetes bacterium]|nr:hypothetical protein [Planctomycetota bacterium]